MQDVPFHPIANIFPLIEGPEFEDLVADIRNHGLHEPITLLDGMILDGRNRYRACQRAGVDALATAYTYDGKNPVAYVVSLNLRRRHLDEGQRAAVAARIATLPKGANQHASIEAPSQSEAADMLNVSRASVQRARQVLDHGAPELVEAVDRGDVSVSAAAEVASLPKEEQAELVARGDKEIMAAAKAIQARRAEEKKAARAEKECKLAQSTIEAANKLDTGLFNVIYADPPWRFEPYSRETGMDRAADNHYPTATLDKICAMRVPAADDCALFLWATAPMLPEALAVVQAWGFTYKSHIIWVKDRIGTGYWARNKHEILLIGTRGSIPAPSPGTQPPSVIEAPVGRHSEKPAAFAEIIEGIFPTVPKLEMFARTPRDGWTVWGNEVEVTQ